MNRRNFLANVLVLPAFSAGGLSVLAGKTDALFAAPPFRRVRPGDAGWPSAAAWEKLKQEVNGHLVKISSPLEGCKVSAGAGNCAEVFRSFRNPYYISDHPALTQSSGWLKAWTSSPSVYAVKADNAAEVVAAVNFARQHHLRLVVKGGGHSYHGTSNAPDSLLVWTKAMNNIALHDQFIPKGGEGKQAPRPAVTLGAGVLWMQAYHAVTTKGGRYVQGGGCATVGVAGLIQSGGFGSHSKRYGMAAGGLLEAEVVTADGQVLIVNEYQHADLFWGLKGGGGGSLAVVTQLTLQTRELPAFFGAVFGSLKANSDTAFQKLLAYIVAFYQEKLFNPHWGEQIRVYGDNSIRLNMLFQGIDGKQAKEVWQPLQEWVKQYPQDYTWQEPFNVVTLPAQRMWDASFFKQFAPDVIGHDNRPGAPEENIFWSGNLEEAGAFWHAYNSVWLPASLLQKDKQPSLADALFAASRHWTVGLHFNKGLAGSPPEEITAARNTATNPEVLEAFALAIIAGCSGPAFPGVPGHEPDLANAGKEADRINQSMEALRRAAPGAGSYVSESSFFEPNWQQSYWGTNYARLASVKKKYDPEGLFFVHHGVGSEAWSEDGFTRLK
jgi:FAD/FMN-containing dehydrogenase